MGKVRRGRVCRVCCLQTTKIRNSTRGNEERTGYYIGVGTKCLKYQLGMRAVPFKRIVHLCYPLVRKVLLLDIGAHSPKCTILSPPRVLFPVFDFCR